jgi:hypothetical protein
VPGAKFPLVNNALMYNGGTDLTVASSSGNGGFRTPGTITQFKVTSSSTTVGAITTTITNYQRFTYAVNYDAILYWLKNTGPNPFPPQLRAGGILFYSAIPDTIDTSVFPMPTGTQAEKDARFWKEYIDEAMGIQQWGFTTTNGVKYAAYSNVAGKMGYGDHFAWPGKTTKCYTSARGLESVALQPSNTKWQVGNAAYDGRYMDYRDNPYRPRLQFWFSPMTMVDFLYNMNMGTRAWMPGTVHESPMWQCKTGVAAALTDIRNNHPNDLVSLISFSKPVGYSPSTGAALQSGTYNSVRAPLSRNYNTMINSLYFPSQVITTGQEISPYDAGITDVPKSMGFMLAYNQFSRGTADTDLRTFATAPAVTGSAGGFGRKGAQKMIIFETDGVCSSTVYAPGTMASTFANNGPYKSWFSVRYDQSASAKNEYPPYLASGATEAGQQTLEVVQQICAADNAGAPGYSSRRKPVAIHTLGFGSLFENPSPAQTTALNLLQQIQYYGNTQTDPATPLDPSKLIIGSSSNRVSLMKTAFSKIMQSGYSVTLID